jgi:hypothetical protein
LDRHLNLFYTYNRDPELIENNLTRAWIVTLRMLSGETRHRLLHTLLDPHAVQQSLNWRPDEFNFEQVELALQGNVDKARTRQCAERYIVAIASLRYQVESGDNSETETTGSPYSSIPDAWLIDPFNRYCFLIESKVGFNPVNDEQIRSHGDWLGFATQVDLAQHLIALTWFDVAEALVLTHDFASEPEKQLLWHLQQYLSFFGYQLFQGLKFSEIQAPPAFAFAFRPGAAHYLNFERLGPPPAFTLALQPAARLLKFERLCPPPGFHICSI